MLGLMPDPIDLRSDTVTKPSPAMRRAMAQAEVGDDVFGDDPTVIALEERAAELTSKPAAVFVASGTMGNLVSHMAHVPRGGEIVTSVGAHLVDPHGHQAADRDHRRRHRFDTKSPVSVYHPDNWQ